MNENIRRLNADIQKEEQTIRDCDHRFLKPFSNPETTREPYGYKLVPQGSDAWGEPEGYRNVIKPRWTRICKLCGHEQHTYTQKPIVSGREPDFSLT